MLNNEVGPRGSFGCILWSIGWGGGIQKVTKNKNRWLSPKSSRQFQSRPKISDWILELDATIQIIKKNR